MNEREDSEEFNPEENPFEDHHDALEKAYERGRHDERKLMMKRPTYYAAFRPGAGWSLDRDERGAYIPLRMVAEACKDENGYQQAISVRLVEVTEND